MFFSEGLRQRPPTETQRDHVLRIRGKRHLRRIAGVLSSHAIALPITLHSQHDRLEDVAKRAEVRLFTLDQRDPAKERLQKN